MPVQSAFAVGLANGWTCLRTDKQLACVRPEDRQNAKGTDCVNFLIDPADSMPSSSLQHWIVFRGVHQFGRPNNSHAKRTRSPRGMSADEDCSHFGMWAMLAAPLIAGNDITKMTAITKAILTNADVIAVNQDPLGKQATDGEPLSPRRYTIAA
jgi:hypothetical protein